MFISYEGRYWKWSLGCLISATLLSACGGAIGAVPTNVPPTAASLTEPTNGQVFEPTIEPTSLPTSQATMEPTSSPLPEPTAAAGGVIPAPLYFNDRGQIFRLEVDGKTRKQITTEVPISPDAMAVTAFDVAPDGGALVYVVQLQQGNTLVQIDAQGTNHKQLYSGGAGLNTPIWSPDGAQIAVKFWVAPEDESELQRGVHLMPAGGGELQLMQEDDPQPQDTGDAEAADARGYDVISWSPDGKRLQLADYSQMVEQCQLAVNDVASGSLIRLESPEKDLVVSCEGGAWKSDSTGLYVLPTKGGVSITPGLWFADLRTNAISTVIPAQRDGMYQIVEEPFIAPDGRLLAFIATAATLPDPFSGEGALDYRMVEISGDGTVTPLREDRYRAAFVVWAPDGSGAFVRYYPSDQELKTAWVPAGSGQSVDLPLTSVDINDFRWGR